MEKQCGSKRDCDGGAAAQTEIGNDTLNRKLSIENNLGKNGS
jgi:hypothetical protein